MENTRWGRPRSFGQLFGAAFGMANAHRRWLIPLVVVSMTPYLALLASGVAVGAGFLLRDPERLTRIIQRGDLETLGGMAVAFGVFGTLTVLLATAGQIFLHAGAFGTLAAAGRGETVTLGLALREGLRRFWTYFCVSFWVGLRILAWMSPFFVIAVVALVAGLSDTPELLWSLVLLVPLAITGMVFAIIKTYAYMFAVPIRIAGDAANSGDAIRMSASATDGRKGYLFGYALVMGLLIGGAGMVLNQLTQAMTLAGGLWLSAPFIIVTELATMVLAMVVQFGVWLAYADAVATRNAESPAARYALGLTGRPFPAPNFPRM